MDIQEALRKKIKHNALLLEIIRNDNVSYLESMHKEEHADIYFDNNLLFCRACELGSMKCIDYLINNKADYRTSNDYGLLTSVQNGYTNLVERLLKLGCDPNLDDGYVLEVAAKYNRLEELKKLISYGANLEDSSALYAAAKHDNLEIVQYLIELGEDAFKLKKLIDHPISEREVGTKTTEFIKAYCRHNELDSLLDKKLAQDLKKVKL